MRKGVIARQTLETNIIVEMNIDGLGKSAVNTGIGFFDHMLTLFSKHSLFDMNVSVQGDLQVDGHHTVEDTGIAIGLAISQALSDKHSIKRYGSLLSPMDEALIMLVADFSGRPYLGYEVEIPNNYIGAFDTELVEEFLKAFCINAGLTLHVRLLSGKNTHHIIEAVFKGLGRVLAEAVCKDKRIIGVMSTKGKL